MYNTSGLAISAPITVNYAATGNQALQLSGFANVGSVKLQATTAGFQVLDATYSDPATPTVSYSADGVSVGAAAAGGIANLETLVMNFSSAIHPQGVQNLRFEITNSNTISNNVLSEAVTFTFYAIDGHELGQYTTVEYGLVTIPVEFSGVARVTMLADTGTSINIHAVQFNDVVNTPLAAPVAPEIIQYTLTDTDGDTSTAPIKFL